MPKEREIAENNHQVWDKSEKR